MLSNYDSKILDDEYDDSYFSDEEKEINVVQTKYVEPSEVKVITMTALSSLSTNVDIGMLYEKAKLSETLNKITLNRKSPREYGKKVKIPIYLNEIYQNICQEKKVKYDQYFDFLDKIEMDNHNKEHMEKLKFIVRYLMKKYGNISEEILIVKKLKGYLYKNKNLQRESKYVKGKMMNQVTFLFKKNKQNLSTKIYKNGVLQIAGCKRIEDVDFVCNFIIDSIKNTYKIDFERKKKIYPAKRSELKPGKHKIIMMNSIFSTNFNINRQKLFNLLKENKHNVDYEPNRYPGVNLKFSDDNDEKCTLLIFESGKVLINGAKSTTNLNNAYNFINNLLKNNYTDVVLSSNI